MMALCKQSSDLYDENPAQAHIIAHSFTLLLAPRTFRPALPVVLNTLAILFCGPLAHVQSPPCCVSQHHHRWGGPPRSSLPRGAGG